MKIHPAVQVLLSEIDDFRSSVRMSPTAFGRLALKDPNFMFDLRQGRTPSLPVIDRVREFIKSSSENHDVSSL